MGSVTRVLVVGNGRMGMLLKDALDADDAFELVGMVGIENREELADGTAPAADLVIDFSHHEMVALLDAYVRKVGCALLSGTTGLTGDDRATLLALGERVAVVHAANYSLGVAMLRRLAAAAAAELAGWDIEIVECHHNQKVDAPSGTALALRDAVDPEHGAAVTNGRAGLVGVRPTREIGMHAIRGGTVAGTHEVLFFGTDEQLCLTHRATSRQIFVTGALEAARRLLAREPGFYTFDELMFTE